MGGEEKKKREKKKREKKEEKKKGKKEEEKRKKQGVGAKESQGRMTVQSRFKEKNGCVSIIREQVESYQS